MSEPHRRIPSFKHLLEHLREDYRKNDRSAAPGFQAVATYRFGVWVEGIPNRFARKPLRMLHNLLNLFVRNFYGIELYTQSQFGRRLRIVHQSGIVIHPMTTLGDDVLLRQGVTIGGGVRAAVRPTKVPVIGNRVEVGPGAVIIGPITVGDDVVIGPNAVVTTNVPPGSIVASPQCRIITPPPRKRRVEPASAPEQAADAAPGNGSAPAIDTGISAVPIAEPVLETAAMTPAGPARTAPDPGP